MRFRSCLCLNTLFHWLLCSHAQQANEITARLTLKGHNRGVICVSFHPDGKTMASGGMDNTVKLWDVRTGKSLATFHGHQSFVDCIAFSSDGKNLVSVSEDAIKWWDIPNKKELASYLGKSRITKNSFRGARTVIVRPDSKAILWGAPWRVNLWEIEKDREDEMVRSRAKLSWFYVFRLAAPRILAVNITRPNIEVWNLSPVKRICTIEANDQAIFCTSISPDGRTLASGSLDELLCFWNIETGKKIAAYKQRAHQVVSLAYSPDGKILAVSLIDTQNRKNGPIRLLDVATGKEMALLRGDRPSWAVFSPDSQTLATCSENQNIKLWDISAFTNPKREK